MDLIKALMTLRHALEMNHGDCVGVEIRLNERDWLAAVVAATKLPHVSDPMLTGQFMIAGINIKRK